MPLIKIIKWGVACDSCGQRAYVTKTNHYRDLIIRYWRCECGANGKCVSVERETTENDPSIVELQMNDGDPARERTGDKVRDPALGNHQGTEREKHFEGRHGNP